MLVRLHLSRVLGKHYGPSTWARGGTMRYRYLGRLRTSHGARAVASGYETVLYLWSVTKEDQGREFFSMMQRPNGSASSDDVSSFPSRVTVYRTRRAGTSAEPESESDQGLGAGLGGPLFAEPQPASGERSGPEVAANGCAKAERAPV